MPLSIFLSTLVGFVVLGLPVAFAILFVSLLWFVFSSSTPTEMIVQQFVNGVESFPLLAIPLFIIAGEVMNAAGMTGRLIKFSETLTGWMTGGLAQVNVLTNTLMGGLSGSANADAAMISKTLVPEMTRRGYKPSFSTALTAAGSVIGPIIPPGIGLILYGFLADVSIGKMFIGGIIPGLLLCIALMITVHLISKKEGYKPSREKVASLKEIWSAFLDAFWVLLLPVLIIGGLRIGAFTSTEAGAVAVVFALLVGFFVYRTLKLKDLVEVFFSSTKITAVIMVIVAAAKAFGFILTWEELPQQAAQLLTTISENPVILLLIINIFLLILGCFTETTANLMILTPILAPIADQIGMDPVAFGVMVVVNLTIGGITPPLGTMMYTVCTINKVSIADYSRQIWPFVIAVVSVLLLITYIPQLVTFLPNALWK